MPSSKKQQKALAEKLIDIVSKEAAKVPDFRPANNHEKITLHDAIMSGLAVMHSRVRHPQTNGICERFHKTILQEFYQPALRRKLYTTIGELQADLDEWLIHYNTERTRQGKRCCGRTPMETLLDGKRNLEGKIRSLNLI